MTTISLRWLWIPVGVALGVLGIPAPAGAASAVGSCGTLGAPGTYSLTSDLAASDGSCITITASGVTLLLAGHTISCHGSGFGGSCQRTGPGGIGVALTPGLSAVTVKGPGTLTGFDTGVVVEQGAALVDGLTVTGPPCDPSACSRPVSNGIAVVGHTNPDGSIDEGPVRVNVVGNSVSNYGRGIALLGARCAGAGACTVYGNTVENSSGDECNGILLSGASGFAVVANAAHGNGAGDCFPPAGIAVGDGSTGNVVANNDVSANVAIGIGVGPGTNGNTFTGNSVVDNPAVDLRAFPGTVNLWADNNRCHTEAGAVPASVCNPGE